jgi:hypothetical protein
MDSFMGADCRGRQAVKITRLLLPLAEFLEL